MVMYKIDRSGGSKNRILGQTHFLSLRTLIPFIYFLRFIIQSMFHIQKLPFIFVIRFGFLLSTMWTSHVDYGVNVKSLF